MRQVWPLALRSGPDRKRALEGALIQAGSPNPRNGRICAFAVDPGSQRGGTTTIKVIYHDVIGLEGRLGAFESFTLQRPRRD
jgi:hypothetical protein